MADCLTQISIELAVIQNHLLVVHFSDHIQGNRELAGVFDIDDYTAAPHGTDRAKRFCSIVNKNIEAFADLFVKHPTRTPETRQESHTSCVRPNAAHGQRSY